MSLSDTASFLDYEAILDQWTVTRPIFDSHIHTILFERGRFDEDTVNAQLEKTFELGHTYGIGRFISLGGFSLYDCEIDVRRVNAMTANLQRRHKDRFCGYAYVNPLLGTSKTAKELDQALGEDGLIGIKCELECNCRDPLFKVITDKAIEYDVPVLQHTWRHTVERKQMEPDSSDLAWIAERNPEITFIMAHLTGSGIAGIYDIKHLKNVYLDTSGAAPLRGYLEAAIDILGPDRILYGSDHYGRSFASQLGRIFDSVHDEATLRKILWENVLTLHGNRLQGGLK